MPLNPQDPGLLAGGNPAGKLHSRNERDVASPRESAQPTAQIEVFDVRPTVKAGNVKAICSIRVGGVTIKEAKIVQQPGQKAWLAMPDRQWTGNDSKTRYRPLVELSDSLKKRASDVALKALEAVSDGR